MGCCFLQFDWPMQSLKTINLVQLQHNDGVSNKPQILLWILLWLVMEYALGFVTIQRQILWLTDAQALRQRWWSDLMWPRVNIPPYPCPYSYSWQGPPTPPHVMCSRIIAPISSYQLCIAPLPSFLVHHDSSYNACQNNPTIYKPISW